MGGRQYAADDLEQPETNREDDQPRPAVEGGVLGILRAVPRCPRPPLWTAGVREPGREPRVSRVDDFHDAGGHFLELTGLDTVTSTVLDWPLL